MSTVVSSTININVAIGDSISLDIEIKNDTLTATINKKLTKSDSSYLILCKKEFLELIQNIDELRHEPNFSKFLPPTKRE